MTALDWLRRSISYVWTDGVRDGLQTSADELKYEFARRIDSRVAGEAIFGREWDVLVVLDACRPDLLAELSPNYAFLPDEPATIRSKGSGSVSWMERNFTTDWADEIGKTAYITGNPFSDDYPKSAEFAHLDEVWRYAWDDDLGTVPARPITDRAIDIARTQDPDRMLVHYMQPHFPSIPDPIGSKLNLDTWGENWDSVWDDLKSGRVSQERVWEAYRANLEHVLDEVKLLRDNVTADGFVISADHGNAVGEFGFYGHPPYNPLPSLRHVPWVETTASDTRTYEPTTQREQTRVDDDEVASRLEDLGYL